MAVTRTPIREYEVVLGRALAVGASTYSAGIRCITAAEWILDVYFIEAGSAFPANTSDAGQKLARMYLPTTSYVWVLDLLRHESPVIASLDIENPSKNTIRCGLAGDREPVGEGE